MTHRDSVQLAHRKSQIQYIMETDNKVDPLNIGRKYKLGWGKLLVFTLALTNRVCVCV